EYLDAARKTMDAEAAAEFEQNVRGMYDQMARIAITPRWARASTTSALAQCRDFCRSWLSSTSPELADVRETRVRDDFGDRCTSDLRNAVARCGTTNGASHGDHQLGCSGRAAAGGVGRRDREAR